MVKEEGKDESKSVVNNLKKLLLSRRSYAGAVY